MLGVLAERWPDLIIVLLVGFVVWFFCRLYYTEIKAVKDKVEHADCKNNRTLINGFDHKTMQIFQKIDSIEDGFDHRTIQIFDKINLIEKAIIAQDPPMLGMFSRSNSPRQLNELGARLFQQSGADKILDAHRAELVSQIEALDSATAYDVEQNAYRVLIDATSKPWFNPLKEFIYNSPVFEGNDVNVATICFVMSLVLRNEYFKIHPEIDSEKA